MTVPSQKKLTFEDYVNMPIDLFLEKAKTLSPRILVKLLGTSKASFLLARCNQYTWKASLGTLPSFPGNQFPGLSPDVLPVHFADLLLGEDCLHCNSSPATEYNFAIRSKVCLLCAQSISYQVIAGLGLEGFAMLCSPEADIPEIAAIFKLVPRSEPGGKFCPGYALWIFDHIMTKKQELTAVNYTRYLEVGAGMMDEVVAHGNSLQTWWQAYQGHRLELRWSNLSKKLANLGWTEEDFPPADTPRHAQWLSMVNPRGLVYGMRACITLLEEEQRDRAGSSA